MSHAGAPIAAHSPRTTAMDLEATQLGLLSAMSQSFTDLSVEVVHMRSGTRGLKLTLEHASVCACSANSAGFPAIRTSYMSTAPLSQLAWEGGRGRVAGMGVISMGIHDRRGRAGERGWVGECRRTASWAGLCGFHLRSSISAGSGKWTRCPCANHARVRAVGCVR